MYSLCSYPLEKRYSIVFLGRVPHRHKLFIKFSLFSLTVCGGCTHFVRTLSKNDTQSFFSAECHFDMNFLLNCHYYHCLFVADVLTLFVPSIFLILNQKKRSPCHIDMSKTYSIVTIIVVYLWRMYSLCSYPPFF